ncbi:MULTISPECIES: RagB/SusD family nutrient uptake outer membrane protein [unclassified Mucilaginibacter]|uniref:RagB/SusD family nutrient uptake outer membrane protein n=1 Tax=unclassified Mucilaginibacter TaxID=2617802 RepID=UPI003390B6C1
MKNYKILSTWLLTAVLLGTASCKKELDVKNPNSPTLEQAGTESGIISLASGGIYLSGFNGSNPSVLNGLNALGDSYFSQGIQYHELLGDNIGAEASNININVVNLPDYAIFDDNTKTTNSSPQKSVLRISNTRDKRPSNVFYLEWTYMYGLNNACNQVLALVDDIKFSGDEATKKNTIKAWCYWWKGFAYSKLGSLYYAGLINDKVNGITSAYVNSAALIAESDKNLDAAAALLTGITNTADYQVVMEKLIPSFVQTGNGTVPNPTMFVHNINSLKARNIVANKKVVDMTSADWSKVLTLVNSGITSSDNVFAGRTSVSNGFFSATGGSVAALTTGPPKSSTFKISERFIQSYQTGDKRLSNNFTAITPYLNQVGGFTFSTRWQLEDGGKNLPGVQVLSDRTPGNYQLYIGPSYEENELMKAEALINTGSVPAALQSIDNVRAAQGAGLAPLAGTNLSTAQATAMLRSERRVALVFRGLAFYDARRYGIIYDISKGGGITDAVIVGSTGTVSTHATINYNFLDYWDVPADEAVLNPPDAGSAPIVNPN